MTKPNALFTGSALTPDLFSDFITRLKHDCRGAGLADHGTADVMFQVEKQEFIYGIDKDFCPNLAVLSDDTYYHSVIDFMSIYREHCIEKLDELCKKNYGKPFDEVDEFEQLLEISELEGFSVFGYQENWKLVNMHFTQSSADYFVLKHGHKYKGKLRVSQESQDRSYEFNAIKSALLTGKLVWKD